MKLLLIGLCFLYSYSMQSQKIRRWNLGTNEVASKRMKFSFESNIFENYSWTKPDINSKEFEFLKGSFHFTFEGMRMQLSLNSDSSMTLMNDRGYKQEALLKRSDGDVYCNKQEVKLKMQPRQRWVSTLSFVMESVPVQQSRMVTSYQYNAATGTSTPVYRTEYYSTYQFRSVPRTTWSWQTYYDYVLEIPNYDYFSFFIDEDTQILVYRIEGIYYIQNPSFILGTDEDGVNYLLSDNNCNGKYTDTEDKVLFNSWNPYLKDSKYKKVPFVKGNSWYDLDFLLNEYFLSFEIEDDLLTLSNENDEYKDSEEYGKLTLTNLPDKAKIKINGKYYRNKRKGIYKTEYGVFKIVIENNGHLSYEKAYIINEEHPEVTIEYVPQPEAAVISVKNIFTDDFFVSVKGENDYERTYFGKRKIHVPKGDLTVEVYCEGSSILMDFSLKPNEIGIFDFEKELKNNAIDATEKTVEEENIEND